MDWFFMTNLKTDITSKATVQGFAAVILWSVTVAAFSYLTPLFSTLFSAVYLSVEPSANLFTGCVLLILGSVLSWKDEK